MLKIAIGSDHAGYDAKTALIELLEKEGVEIIDCGTNSRESCHYPIYAHAVSKKIVEKCADFGVLICSSGEGICIAANKNKGIRCGLAYNDEVASLMRLHNHCNIIAFGAKYMSVDEMYKRTLIFIKEKEEGGRHDERVSLIEK